MNITLPPEHQTWIEAEVAAGRFDSIDDAVAAAVAELMSLDADAPWAKPRAEPRRGGHPASGRQAREALRDAIGFPSSVAHP